MANLMKAGDVMIEKEKIFDAIEPFVINLGINDESDNETSDDDIED